MKTLSKTPQTVNRDELEKRVIAMYTGVALQPEVQYHFEMGRQLAERLGYDPAQLNQIPAAAIDSFAGVGHHMTLADIQEGEVVVDLGSGSGMDAFYAAKKVKISGEVIGIDMTQAQLDKAKKLKQQYGFHNTFFVESHIEQLPVISNCIDVVISNGVINLSSEKERVFQEAARVLKYGGRLAISDIVSTVPLPEKISCNASLWAACIGGAMQEQLYLEMIESAGLRIQEVKVNPYQFLSNGAKGATQTYGIKSISVLAGK